MCLSLVSSVIGPKRIHMALGADRSVIRKFVVWQGIRLALVGVVAGIVVPSLLPALLSYFLFASSLRDPAVFVSAPPILTAVALLAVWLTRRARLQSRSHAGVARGVIRKRLVARAGRAYPWRVIPQYSRARRAEIERSTIVAIRDESKTVVKTL